MHNGMRQETECEQTITERLLRVVDDWETSLTFFCLVFGFFLGVVLIFNPLHPMLQRDSAYYVYDTIGMVLIGVTYVVLTLYAALYPERDAGYAAIAVIAGTGLYAAIRAHEVVGMGFWSLALLTVALGSVRRIRAIQRGERR